MVTISVVMPVYNVEAYIEQAIESVLAQTMQDFELIIIDDDGQDRSIDLARQFRDDRIRIIQQNNRGLAGARNTGIRDARGKYIAFLDSDDFWDSRKLERHVKLMESKPDCGVSFSSSLFVDENGQSLNRIQQPERKKDYDAAYVFIRNPIGNGSAPVIRRQVLKAIEFAVHSHAHRQYFDESLRQSEDVECWTRISLLTKTTFMFIDEPLTCYRVNNGGLSANVQDQYRTWLSLLDKLHDYAPDFAKTHGNLAKAFQLRYLARRLVFQQHSFKAAGYIVKAVHTDHRVIWREPGKTLETAMAALVFCLIPAPFKNPLMKRLMGL